MVQYFGDKLIYDPHILKSLECDVCWYMTTAKCVGKCVGKCVFFILKVTEV